MNARPSLFERAAEIYDFNSGLRVESVPADLPPPQPRLEPARSTLAPAPAPAGAPPIPAAKEQVQRAPRLASTVRHARAEVNRALLTDSGFLLPDSPPSALAEEMRLIKRRLLTAADAGAQRTPSGRVALIASGQQGEGKTFVAINLALSICGEQDRSVLLVDGDTSQPDIARRFGIDAEAGLVDALADQDVDPESLVIDTDIEGLSILSAGRKERNVPELLASARTPEVLTRLLSADPHRIVLIDSPPALAVSTASVLAGHAGQTLVVVRADATSEADLKETVELLGGPARLSLLLNGGALALGGRRFGQYEEDR